MVYFLVLEVFISAECVCELYKVWLISILSKKKEIFIFGGFFGPITGVLKLRYDLAKIRGPIIEYPTVIIDC